MEVMQSIVAATRSKLRGIRSFQFLRHSFPISVTSPLVRLTHTCRFQWWAFVAPNLGSRSRITRSTRWS